MKQVDETAGAGYEVTVQALPPIPRANQDVQTAQRSKTLTVGAVGYADDCYPIRQTVPELEAPMQMTSRWLQKTGQVINASKSLSFEVNNAKASKVELDGEVLPRKSNFKSLGI